MNTTENEMVCVSVKVDASGVEKAVQTAAQLVAAIEKAKALAGALAVEMQGLEIKCGIENQPH